MSAKQRATAAELARREADVRGAGAVGLHPRARPRPRGLPAIQGCRPARRSASDGAVRAQEDAAAVNRYLCSATTSALPSRRPTTSRERGAGARHDAARGGRGARRRCPHDADGRDVATRHQGARVISCFPSSGPTHSDLTSARRGWWAVDRRASASGQRHRGAARCTASSPSSPGMVVAMGNDRLGGIKLWLAGRSGTYYYYAHLVEVRRRRPRRRHRARRDDPRILSATPGTRAAASPICTSRSTRPRDPPSTRTRSSPPPTRRQRTAKWP